MPVSAYKWSDAERAWLDRHGIGPTWIIGKRGVKPAPGFGRGRTYRRK